MKHFKKQRKITLIISALFLLNYFHFFVFAAEHKAANRTASYSTITEVFDWGPAITKVIVDVGSLIPKGSVKTDTFKVQVVRTETRKDTPILGAEKGYRNITKAYVSGRDGELVANGKYVTLEMEVGPELAIGSPINYSMTTNLNAWVESKYTIIQQKDIIAGKNKIAGLIANVCTGDKKKLVDDFKVSKASYENIKLKYASYSPSSGKGEYPLIIWLHGMGEGGNDGILPIAANKASNFASKKIQGYFGGAYILAPQAPTFWMDGLNQFGDGTSKYENALMSLIKDYVTKHKDINKNRIYIGGDSNGGYMTMLMIRDYGNYFAAAFPTCEALRDTLITDSDIQKMKNMPIWFTAAKTDTTVPVEQYVVPTYNRLVKAGAKNVQLSLFNYVVDTSGLYKKSDGSAYEYNGHFSWIYVYNNQCVQKISGKTTTIMEWLSSQHLKK